MFRADTTLLGAPWDTKQHQGGSSNSSSTEAHGGAKSEVNEAQSGVGMGVDMDGARRGALRAAVRTNPKAHLVSAAQAGKEAQRCRGTHMAAVKRSRVALFAALGRCMPE